MARTYKPMDHFNMDGSFNSDAYDKFIKAMMRSSQIPPTTYQGIVTGGMKFFENHEQQKSPPVKPLADQIQFDTTINGDGRADIHAYLELTANANVNVEYVNDEDVRSALANTIMRQIQKPEAVDDALAKLALGIDKLGLNLTREQCRQLGDLITQLKKDIDVK